jgi:hypothetical protein
MVQCNECCWPAHGCKNVRDPWACVVFLTDWPAGRVSGDGTKLLTNAALRQAQTNRSTVGGSKNETPGPHRASLFADGCGQGLHCDNVRGP